MSAHIRTYSRQTVEALSLMGGQIRLARKQRRMSEADLAERIGVARSTLQAIEKGHPRVEIGLVFEAAILMGLPLFAAEAPTLADRIAQVEDKIALLPRSIRHSRTEAKDDF